MKVSGKQSKKRTLRKAVFLDRDGTIIKHVELLHKPSEVRLLPQAARAIKAINKLGFLVIVITNQPVVARGIITPKEVDKIHAFLIKRLRKFGAKIDAVYFCPHHPEATLKKYRLRCGCRKPNPGMLLKALHKFNIDKKNSFMVGDAMIDVVAGRRAGLKTILVKTGPGHARDKEFAHIKPDFVVKNLTETANIVKKFS